MTLNFRTAPTPDGTDSEVLDPLQRVSFDYFLKEVNPANGLIADKDEPGAPSSIAAIGLGVSAYTVAVERGFRARSDAARSILTILRFFDSSPQGPEADATGYNGFYYHFLDMKTGRRTGGCELSTIDTAILIAGILNAAIYFISSDPSEQAFTEPRRQTLRSRELAVGAKRPLHPDLRLDPRRRISSLALG